MRIKKVSQTTATQAQVVDGYSTSTTDSYSCNYVNNIKETYSTNETVTNKIWVDNKPIYRKVMYFETATSQANNSAVVDVTSLSIDNFINVTGVCTNQNFILGANSQAIAWSNDKHYLYVYFNNDSASSYQGFFIAEYTKTN